MKLLLAVLAATCGIQDQAAGRCGSLAERVEACVGASIAIEMVGDRRCEAILELGTDWRAADECRYRLKYAIRPACEAQETYREDVPGYAPPKSRKERVRACVEVRLQCDYGCRPGDERQHCRDVRGMLWGQCGVKVRVDERVARLKAGLPVPALPRASGAACSAAPSTPAQRSVCCARYGLGGDCR